MSQANLNVVTLPKPGKPARKAKTQHRMSARMIRRIIFKVMYLMRFIITLSL